MRLLRNLASLLVLCMPAVVLTSAQVTKPPATAAFPTTGNTTQTKLLFLAPDDGLSVLSAALESRKRSPAKVDCSHLVHDIYERAGFPFEYASSYDLYSGVNEFHRVTKPQPGDLVVWPGHVGIIVSPAQHSFYSSLRTGLGVEPYDSPYWKQRGKPRFFRYVKLDQTENPAGLKAPTLTPTSLNAPGFDLHDDNPPTSNYVNEDPIPEVPRVHVIQAIRPTSKDVFQVLQHAFDQSGEGLREQNIFHLTQPLLIVSQVKVQQVKIKGDQGWAEVQISEPASLITGESNLKMRVEKQRWPLHRRDQTSWILALPQSVFYVSQDSAVQVLAHQLASMTEASDAAGNNIRQKAQVAELLHTLLRTRN